MNTLTFLLLPLISTPLALAAISTVQQDDTGCLQDCLSTKSCLQSYPQSCYCANDYRRDCAETCGLKTVWVEECGRPGKTDQWRKEVTPRTPGAYEGVRSEVLRNGNDWAKC